MAQYSIDDEGVSRVRTALAADPATFRAGASRLSVTVSSAASAVDEDSDALCRALDRFRLVHVALLHAVADAVAALSGDLDLAVDSERETQLGVAAAYSTMVGLGEAS